MFATNSFPFAAKQDAVGSFDFSVFFALSSGCAVYLTFVHSRTEKR